MSHRVSVTLDALDCWTVLTLLSRRCDWFIRTSAVPIAVGRRQGPAYELISMAASGASRLRANADSMI
jgi:hypothetical protein